MVLLRAYADCGYATHTNGKSQYPFGFDAVDGHDYNDELAPIDSAKKITLFSVKTMMAPNVDLATAEGEIGALVEVTKDTIFYRGCLAGMHLPQINPTPTYNDNQPSVLLATKYSGNHKRVRCMLPKIHWLMEKSNELFARFLYLSTDTLPVDLGTKTHIGRRLG